MSQKMFVFVYGTLKRTEPNNHWLTNQLNGKANFVCCGNTIQLYPLIKASKYDIPFLLDHPGVGKKVEGEVYSVDDKMLRNIDILEEYPAIYTRREEEILCRNSDLTENVNEPEQNIMAWIYFLSDFKSDLLRGPFLESYSAGKENKLPETLDEETKQHILSFIR